MSLITAFERMKLRENSTGATIREERIYNSKDIFNDLFSDDPSFRKNVEIIRGDVVVGSIDLRMDDRKIKNGAPQMNIYDITNNDIRFTFGDVFHTQTMEDNGEIVHEYWICIEAYNRHSIQRNGLVEECNLYLPFQNKETYEIHGRWCSVRSPYSSGLDENKTVVVGNNKFDIKMPYDDETKLFHQDYRFIIDFANNQPIPYITIRTDAVTNRYKARDEGFLMIKVEQDQIQTDDRPDLMIANYKEIGEKPPDPVGSIMILSNGSPITVSPLILKAGGSARTFSADIKDASNNIITTATALWYLDLVPPSTMTGITMVDNAVAKTTTISATSQATVGMEYILRCEWSDITYGEFKAEIRIRIDSLF